MTKSKSGLYIVLHAAAKPIPPAVPQHDLAIAKRVTHYSFDTMCLSQFEMVRRT